MKVYRQVVYMDTIKCVQGLNRAYILHNPLHRQTSWLQCHKAFS